MDGCLIWMNPVDGYDELEIIIWLWYSWWTNEEMNDLNPIVLLCMLKGFCLLYMMHQKKKIFVYSIVAFDRRV